MLKKLPLISAIFLLAACGSAQSTPEPKYKITTEQFQQVMLAQNNVEQCIYPQLRGLSYEEAKRTVYDNQSQAEKAALFRYTDIILRSVIGDVQYGMFIADEASQQYFSEMHKQHNHQFAPGMNPKECEVVKARFNHEVQNFRGY